MFALWVLPCASDVPRKLCNNLPLFITKMKYMLTAAFRAVNISNTEFLEK